MIFFDLVLGVDATLQVLRLVSGLYSGGQEVGRPTPLPPVHCQPGGALPYAHSLPPGNYALLSVKQPVPRRVLQPCSFGQNTIDDKTFALSKKQKHLELILMKRSKIIWRR